MKTRETRGGTSKSLILPGEEGKRLEVARGRDKDRE